MDEHDHVEARDGGEVQPMDESDDRGGEAAAPVAGEEAAARDEPPAGGEVEEGGGSAGTALAAFVQNEAAESDDGEDDDEEDDDDDDDADVENDPKANEYEKDGFLVLDSDEDDQEQKAKEKKKTSRRDEERFLPLEEDDLELIGGPGGKKKRIKRLKRKGVIESDEEPAVASPPSSSRAGAGGNVDDEGEGEGYGDDDEEGGVGAAVETGGDKSRAKSQSDVAPAADEEEDDGFIVGRKRPRNPDAVVHTLPSGAHISEQQLDDWNEIFGDEDDQAGEEYDGDFVPPGEEAQVSTRQPVRREEEEDEMQDAGPDLHRLFEPSVLESQYLTKKDMEVRAEDIPERFQIRIPNRPPPEPLELESEVGWIQRMCLNEKGALSEMERSDTTAKKIYNVLHFLRNDLLEVPFIVTYRIDYVAPLGLDECWEIYNWDEKWHRLSTRKKQLLELYGNVQEMVQLGAEERYIQLISDAETEEDVEDLSDYFHYYFPEKRQTADSASLRRPAARDRAQEAERAGYTSVAPLFAITATQFGENLFNNQLLHSPVDSPLMPEEATAEMVKIPRGLTVDRVIASIRSYLARQLAHDPYVRDALRETYQEHLTLSTLPTEEKGIEEITYWHRFRNVKRLDRVPLFELRNSDLFALMLEAERTGYIRIMFEVGDVIDEFMELYQSKTFDAVGTAWNKQRRLILNEALSAHLHPRMQKEARKRLEEWAFHHIARSASQEISKVIATRPLEHAKCQFYQNELEELDGDLRNYRGPLGFHTMGVVVPADHQESPFVVVIDAKGSLVHWVKTSFIEQRNFNAFVAGQGESRRQMLQKEDAQKIRDLILEYRPGLIAISTHPGSTGARLAFEAFQSIQMAPGPILAPIVVKLREELPRVYPNVHWVDGRAAHVFRNTPAAIAEHPDFPPSLREALSVARLANNPLFEYARLWDDSWSLGFVSFDPLQHVVPRAVMKQHMEQSFIDATCEVGVDINDAAKYAHLAGTLQFVPGLGPRKARDLLNQIIHSGKSVDRRTGDLRDMLTNHDSDSDHVFTNAIAFLRVVKHKNYDSAPLDNSRVHPNDYRFALKIAVDAADDGQRQGDAVGEDEPETEKNNVIRAAMMVHNEEIRRTVDIKAMAEIWKQNYGEDKFQTLEMVKEEMLAPWRDNRHQSEPMEPRDAFYIVFEESPESLPEGKLMRGVVRSISKRGQPGYVRGVAAHIELEEGNLTGTIRRENISDKDVEDVEEVVQVGQPVLTRLNYVNFERWELDLTSRGSDLKDIDRFESAKTLQERYPRLKWRTAEMERYRLEEEKHEAERERILRRDRQGVAAMRVVDHPSFRNFTQDDVRTALEDAPVGEAIFRPSTKGSDFLTLSFKGLKNQVVHMVVVEKEKPNATALGRRLSIKGFNEEYEDLDEVIARYVNPIAQLMTDLSMHHRFSPLSEAEIEEAVREQKRTNPDVIAYHIGVDEANPGWFKLIYLPGKTTIMTETISLRPTGYRLRRRMFDTMKHLLDWFKRHWNDRDSGRGGSGRDQGGKRSRR